MHRSCTSKARWEYLLRLQLSPVPLYFTIRYWSASEPLACLKQTFHQGIPGLLSVSSARASTYLRLPGLLAPTLARSLSLSQHSIALPSSVTHSLFLLGFAYSISYAIPSLLLSSCFHACARRRHQSLTLHVSLSLALSFFSLLP